MWRDYARQTGVEVFELDFRRGKSRRIEAITSGPRSVMRRAKKTSSQNKLDHVVGSTGTCEVDTAADTCCAGKNHRVLEWTGQTCSVSGFHDDYEALENVPVAQTATAYVDPDTGVTTILIFNETLYFGNAMDHSLINPNQIRSDLLAQQFQMIPMIGQGSLESTMTMCLYLSGRREPRFYLTLTCPLTMNFKLVPV